MRYKCIDNLLMNIMLKNKLKKNTNPKRRLSMSLNKIWARI